MGLLDANARDLETAALAPRAPEPKPEPGLFHNFWSSAGNAYMRSMAEAGRAVSMAAGAVPVIADALIGDDNKGERFADRYFRWHDETFGRAVEHWTPKPEEVGTAGEVVGSLAGGVSQFLANPALMVGTSQLSTSEDLVRKGVPADAALVAGDVAGLANLAGIALPIFGKSLPQRIATGMLGNVATNAPQAAITQQIVQAAGRPDLAAQFDPLDPKARTVDLLLGAVFGAKAHFDARAADALMTANSARHIEHAAAPPDASPPELVRSVDATRQAIEQISRGEEVSVPPVYAAGRAAALVAAEPEHAATMRGLVDDAAGDPGRPIVAPDAVLAEPRPAADPQAVTAARQALQEWRASGKPLAEFLDASPQPPEVHNLLIGLSELDAHAGDAMLADYARTAEALPKMAPEDAAADVVEAARQGRTVTAAERSAPDFSPYRDVRLPTDDFDPATGAPRTISAEDALNQAHTEAADMKARAKGLMQAAATCLLGRL